MLKRSSHPNSSGRILILIRNLDCQQLSELLAIVGNGSGLPDVITPEARPIPKALKRPVPQAPTVPGSDHSSWQQPKQPPQRGYVSKTCCILLHTTCRPGPLAGQAVTPFFCMKTATHAHVGSSSNSSNISKDVLFENQEECWLHGSSNSHRK